MKTTYNLGSLDWALAGSTPYVWRQQRSIESGATHNAEVTAVPARVPGSVQGALRDAGVLADWNVGLEFRRCEWVENRHWVYTARLPNDWLQEGATIRLRALGLDYSGWVLVNGRTAGTFVGSLVPHVFDLTAHLQGPDNTLQIVFDCPPRWLGQIGYTSQMKEWKPRFNYHWDWTVRLVQIGIWDDLLLELNDGQELLDLDCSASARAAPTGDGVGASSAAPAQYHGVLSVRGIVIGNQGETVRVALERDGGTIRTDDLPVRRFRGGIVWDDLPVELWWPNGAGAQPLYALRCRLLDGGGNTLDEISRDVGFKSVAWKPCEGAPPEADPWLCEVNGRPVFLQGVNWTPIRPNFADVGEEDYRRRLDTYRRMGCTVLRVWGGAILEKEIFYDLCDEMGLLVWQEFPMSSSGLDDLPPDAPQSIEEMAEIAESYIQRRRHHASLLLWSGGNELQYPDRPIDTAHPMIARLAQVVAERDPGRRFLPSSSSGPHFTAAERDFGKGIHWDVHGPWNATGDLDGEWTRYWQNDDALFRSEVGAPGASSVELIRAYRGDLPETPGTRDNPLWKRTSWWIEWPVFVEERGREPESLEDYVTWSQERQRRALGSAACSARGRFPRCGGFILWMGHDCFPCTANTAIVDFNGDLKPAGVEIGRIFRDERL
jgi:beta-mannosidase